MREGVSADFRSPPDLEPVSSLDQICVDGGQCCLNAVVIVTVS